MPKIRTPSLESATARLKLPVAKNPAAWVKVAPGVGLGYRRTASVGSWIVRVADGKGNYHARSIGQADDYGVGLTYWQAQEKARTLGRGTDDEQKTAKPMTVADACKAYQQDLERRGGDHGNILRLLGHLKPALLDRAIVLLSAEELKRWRDGVARNIAPATVNRVATVFKAVLNLAADHDARIISRRAWEIGLQSLRGAEHARNVILDQGTIAKLVGAARAQSVELGLFVEVAAMTGSRTSQLSRVEVQDIVGAGDKARLFVPVSRKGKGAKAVPGHSIPISADLAARLRVFAAGRLPSDALLTKCSGQPWKKSDHSRLFKRAVAVVGLDCDKVSIYALRHSSIVRQLMAGVPIRVVAAMHDTSVAMIERNYSVHIGDQADAMLRLTIPDFNVPSDDNVVALRP